MDSQVPRNQIRLMALMVLLIWWAYIDSVRPVMLPPRNEKRLVFPPDAIDPLSAYKHLLYPRARREPVDVIPSDTPTQPKPHVA